VPGGEDLTSKEGWVQTPSGLRLARTGETLMTSIPKLSVPRPKFVSDEAAPPAGPGLPAIPPAPVIPLWLQKEAAMGFKIAFAALFVIGVIVAFKSGESRGRKLALRENIPAPAAVPAAVPAPPPAEFPEELLPPLDAALALLRNGDNLDALDALNKLVAANPKAPSLQYATAIAALQAGYPREAERLADSSIQNGFRVSDSWALKAAIAAAKSKGVNPEQQALLRKAIAADPMNPAPFIELASLLRYQGKNDSAVALLASASSRLNPADAQTVVETTRAILAVDATAGDVPPSGPVGIPSKDLPNAYSEMKRGNFENAAVILRFCRDQTSPDIFSYLVNDPALQKFTSRPELKEFY
jgi:tetratricopeptide (TPR) repeat protein